MRLFIEGPIDSGRAELSRVALAGGHTVTELQPEGALAPGAARLPPFESVGFEWGVLVGETPSRARYAAIVEEAAAKRVVLLNDVAQHRAALDFALAVPRLEGLIARTEVLGAVGELDAVLARLPPPLSIQGGPGTRASAAPDEAVAADAAAVRARVAQLLADQSPAPVLLRELLPLRQMVRPVEGFPTLRHHRFFVLDAEVIATGPLSPNGDHFGPLLPRELSEVQALAREVAVRLKVPWLRVDLGQLETGDWRVLETGDPGCGSLGSVTPATFITALAAGLEARQGC